MAIRDTRSPELILAERRARNSEYQRQWRKAHPERAIEIQRKYLAKKADELKHKEGESG